MLLLKNYVGNAGGSEHLERKCAEKRILNMSFSTSISLTYFVTVVGHTDAYLIF